MQTDSEGRFELDGLDVTLLFRVLIIAPGRRAVVTEHVDPGEQELHVQLWPAPVELPPDRMLRGRVLDEDGTPVFGAMVMPRGAKTAEQRWWGVVPGVDQAAVTDEEGRFVITSQDSKLGLDVEVTAPGFAVRPGELLELNGQEHEIRLQQGVMVQGRLLHDSRPVAYRAIGIVQIGRFAGQFVGEVTRATNDHGQFFFPNLLPAEKYVLYTLCSGSAEESVLKTRNVETGANNTTVDLGTLEAIQGLTLAGRVELPAGSTLPLNSKLRVSRDPAWDWCEVALESDGSFAVRGLPPEVFTVSIAVSGFSLDSSRLRFQSLDERAFGLRLREDRGDIVIPVRVTPK